MNLEDIRIETIRQAELTAFSRQVQSASAVGDVKPITPTRAASQSCNPYARPDDPVLLVAYQGQRCIGYHGLLPGRLISGGPPCPVHWATAFYVAPSFRKKGIGRLLLEEIRRLKIDFVTPQMTPSAEQAYRRAGYLDLGHLDYCQLRADRLSLRRYWPHPEAGRQPAAQRLLTRFYRLRKHLFYRKLVGRGRAATAAVALRQVGHINPIFETSPGVPAGVPAFYRGIEAVNWMLATPWVLETSAGASKEQNYYFSSARDRFHYEAVEIINPGETRPRGFVVLSLSSKHGRSRVKILDHYCPDEAGRRQVMAAAFSSAARIQADRVEFTAALQKDCRKWLPGEGLIKKQRRIYMYAPAHAGSPLAAAVGHIKFDYCDGDTAFT